MKVLKKLVPALIVILSFTFAINAQEKSNKNGVVYSIVEEMPEYPGGEEALRNDIANAVKYPVMAQEKGIQGKVYISFVVDEAGKVTESKIARGVDPLLDKEALRVVNELNKTWSPGKQKGKPVKVSYTVPINFALKSGNESDKKQSTVSENGDVVFFIVEEMPEFPGGETALREFIAKSVKYPVEAKKNGIQGKVYVSYVIDVDGSVTAVKIERGVDPALDKEAIRVTNEMPIWKPGKQKGIAVKVQYTMPIHFALN